MCGICGFAGKGKIEDLHRINNTLHHRGPDAEGYFVDQEKKVFLGHKRLSIIDLFHGKQPMTTPDGKYTIVFNGEIYNHAELRTTLEAKEHVFRTDHSDTEVLLHGYREWGPEMVHRLNGMWAFTLYDKGKKQLFLSCDRFGKKPLFYSLGNDFFVFSSELKAIVKHPSIRVEVSSLSIQKYFAYGFIPSPNTIFKRINKLPGGCNLIFGTSDFQIFIQKYWDFKLDPDEEFLHRKESQVCEMVLELFKKSVNRRLISDVPLGIFLSGGIDSSAITAFASKRTKHQKLKTFSIEFTEPGFDESPYSKKVSTLFNTDHFSKLLLIDESRNVLPSIINKLDEPIGDSSIIPTYLLCHETKKKVTVALGGDGGDELFAGYDPFHALCLAKIYKRIIPKAIHKAIRLAMNLLPVSHRNMSLDFKLKRTLRGLSYQNKIWNPVWLGPLEPKELKEMFYEKADIENIYSEAIQLWDDNQHLNIIDQTLQFYTKLYLQDDILVKVDRASMMNSLEVRSPFLDIELVDFIRRLPSELKYRNGVTKYILKKALRGTLPDYIINRSKHGFGVPIGKWFRDGSLKWNFAAKETSINKQVADSYYFRHKMQKEDNRLFLYNYWLLNQITNSL